MTHRKPSLTLSKLTSSDQRFAAGHESSPKNDISLLSTISEILADGWNVSAPKFEIHTEFEIYGGAKPFEPQDRDQRYYKLGAWERDEGVVIFHENISYSEALALQIYCKAMAGFSLALRKQAEKITELTVKKSQK